MGLLAWLTRDKQDGVDIYSPAHKADPFPFYAGLRDASPVHKVNLPAGQSAWLVTRFDDVAAVLKDERFAKDKYNALTPEQAGKEPWMPPLFRPLTRNMLDLDPPDHTRLRALVSKAFTPRIVELLRPGIEALAERLLDGLRGRAGFDLIRDFALPIPTAVIADMLGVPPADRHRFHRWSNAIVSTDPSPVGMLRAVPPVWSFLRYIRQLVQRKRAAPADDLLTALVQAEEAGDRLSEDELVAMTFLLLVAGHETTVNLLGNGIQALLDHPDQLARVREDPRLVKPAVEELLRFAGPLETATERFAREDVVVAGVTIPRGSLVLAAVASANRDMRQFPDADRLDVSREPNRHLAFGLGPHFCPGAPLARLEAQVAIAALLRRVTCFRPALSRGALRWRRGLAIRGMEALPVTVVRWS